MKMEPVIKFGYVLEDGELVYKCTPKAEDWKWRDQSVEWLRHRLETLEHAIDYYLNRGRTEMAELRSQQCEKIRNVLSNRVERIAA